ncbi:MAG TPA: ATP-binding protein, partial [Chitinophagaceae bacterium]|nr:ATP-binding protein [Chitinophagaceae bacterium]
GDISSKMKEVIWSLNTENDQLSSLISYIQRQARSWLENYPCQLHITIPEKIPDLEISGESRRNIFLTVKEAVHNIIKHSGANKVNINIACNEQLIISVSDNGKGIHIDENINTGNGLKNMKQRIHQLNGKFLIQNHEGITLTFEIPYK